MCVCTYVYMRMHQNIKTKAIDQTMFWNKLLKIESHTSDNFSHITFDSEIFKFATMSTFYHTNHGRGRTM